MIKSIIRSGQLTLHHIRMFVQVAGRAVFYSFFIFILSVMSLFYIKTPSHDWYIAGKIGEAIAKKITKDSPFLSDRFDQRIQFRSDIGTHFTFTSSSFLQKKGVYFFKERTVLNLKASVKLAGWLSGMALLLIILFLLHRSKKILSRKHLRGARFLEAKQLAKEIKRHNKLKQQESKRYYGDALLDTGMSLGGVPLPLEADTQNILLIGSPGGGKTICTNELLEQARKKGHRAIVYDIEGVYIPTYYRPEKDVILNPLDQRTPSWNLWEECSSPSEFNDMASMIVPDQTGNLDPFWTKAARVMLAISASQFGKEKQKNGEVPHMRDFLKHLFASSKEEVEALLKGTMGQAMVGKDLEKGTKSIILTLVTYCSSLLYIKDSPSSSEVGGEKEGKNRSDNDSNNERSQPFSIRKWVEEEGKEGEERNEKNEKNERNKHNGKNDSWLFISTKEKYQEALAPVLSLWFDIILSAFVSLPENYDRRLWLYLDELSSLAKQTKLTSFLERGRKRGGCFIGSIHDPNQLAEIYGKTTAATQKSLIGTTLYFYTNNDESALRAAHHLGQEEFVEAKEGYSLGAHEMRDGITINHVTRKDFVVMPSEITFLKKQEAFMRTAGGFPITKLRFSHKFRLKNEPAFIERDQSDIQHVLKEVKEVEKQAKILEKELLGTKIKLCNQTTDSDNEEREGAENHEKLKEVVVDEIV